jgi:hypothetical protein
MNLNKIIRSLDLSKSDARDKTIEGIIEYILYCINEDITADNLNVFIKEELSIELYKTDLEDGLNKLLNNGSVKKDSQTNKFSLSDDRNIELKRLEVSNSEARDRRFNLFGEKIKKYSSKTLSTEDIKAIWSILTEYIYECYLEHGKIALNAFSGKRSINDSDADLTSILNKYTKKFNDPLLEIAFRKYVENFSTEVSSESLDYLVGLANKTEAFFALGLSKDDYDHIYKDIVFDWTIFVDTNFLYSILDLHSHPANEASKVLVELGIQLNIKFRYLQITLQELQNKSKDFDSAIPQNLQYSQIKALIQSEQLDSFSMRYFEKKLLDMDNTPHPIDVVGHAINNLKSKGITIFRTNFEKLSNDDEYLKDQESKYNDYLNFLDQQRAEKGYKIKGAKDPKQIYHDTFLREAISYLRSAKVHSINDVKYFGVTLDKRLIKFDNYIIMKKKDGLNVPIFFSPSILLKKLLNYSPVKSDDYRRAFIRTLSTPALDSNSFTSKIAIRSVKYFYNMGISDEKMILNCIKDEMFLNKFKELESNREVLDAFVESQIQQNYKKLNEELNELEESIDKKNELIREINNQSNENLITNEKLSSEVDILKNTLNVYYVTLNQFKDRSKKNIVNQNQLTIDDEKKNVEQDRSISLFKEKNQQLLNRVQLLEKDKIYSKWKNKSLLYLIPIIIILTHIFLVFFWQNASWNYVTKLLDWDENLSESRKELVKGLVGSFLGGCLILPLGVIFNRFFNKNSKKEFYKGSNLSPIFPVKSRAK